MTNSTCLSSSQVNDDSGRYSVSSSPVLIPFKAAFSLNHDVLALSETHSESHVMVSGSEEQLESLKVSLLFYLRFV